MRKGALAALVASALVACSEPDAATREAPTASAAASGADSAPPAATGETADDARFGLSENMRKAVFQVSVRAEAHGQREAAAEFPNDPMKQLTRGKELVEKYKSMLAETLGITPEQLDEISIEAAQKDWPMPTDPID